MTAPQTPAVADSTPATAGPLVVTAYGQPITQGSKTKGRYGNIRDANASTLKPWRDNVRGAALAIGAERISCPVAVEITFYFDRPATHYRTGRNAHLLRDNAPTRPANVRSGDIDKLQRSCFDALTDAGIWRDDAQVVDVAAHKKYVSNWCGLGKPGVVIGVWPLT